MPRPRYRCGMPMDRPSGSRRVADGAMRGSAIMDASGIYCAIQVLDETVSWLLQHP